MNQVFLTVSRNFRISVVLSQHSSAISSLIVADWPLHDVIQNLKRLLFSPHLKFQRRNVRHSHPRIGATAG